MAIDHNDPRLTTYAVGEMNAEEARTFEALLAGLTAEELGRPSRVLLDVAHLVEPLDRFDHGVQESGSGAAVDYAVVEGEGQGGHRGDDGLAVAGDDLVAGPSNR